MSFQDKPKVKSTTKRNLLLQGQQQAQSSLLINSSFSLGNEQKYLNKEITQEVLKKVSQTIVSLHSNLVPKTQNIQIYRDLSDQQQKMLKQVQDNKLIHTILAGVLAIDSCLKYIHRQQTYIVSSLMKGVTICLGNYKKIEEQFLSINEAKISQNFLKFYDSLKLIISDIHKIPAAKVKKNQIEKHNQLISKALLNNELRDSFSREQNLLFSLLAQQNNSLRIKLNELEKELNEVERQKQKILKSNKNLEMSEKKKRDSQNNLTQTGSESMKGIQDEVQIRQLKQEIIEKNDIILKMNEQFAVEIEKYQKVFKRLEEENKILKKYNDLDTAYILEQLEYEIEMLRQQKKNDQSIISQIMSKMDRMSWNRNQVDDSSYRDYGKNSKLRYEGKFNQNFENFQPRSYEVKRNRCPSVSPSNKQQNILNRYFSPNGENHQKYGRNSHQNPIGYERKELRSKRNNSPRFGNACEEKGYEDIKERVSRSKLKKQGYPRQSLRGMKQFEDDPGQMRRSNSKLGNINSKLGNLKMSLLGQQNFQIDKLKKQMRRSKFLNEQIGYL